MAGPFSLEGDDSGLPHTSRSGIAYEVESCTVKTNWVPRANLTTVNVRVLGDDADRFIEDMVGRVYLGSPASGGAALLRRDLPEQNPLYENQWCTRCEQIDQGGNQDTESDGPGALLSGYPDPRWMRFRVTFEGMPFDLKTDSGVDGVSGVDERELFRYVRRSRKSYSKEQQFPGGGFFITGSGPPAVKLMTVGFRVVIFADVQYVHYRVPVDALPLANYTACEGKINVAAFDVGARGAYNWPTGTLLYESFDDDDKYFDANGDWVCDVVHTMKYKQIGWNNYLDNTGAAVAVDTVGDGSGTKAYSTADFKTLFQFS